MRLLLLAVGLVACHDGGRRVETKSTTPTSAPTSAHGSGRDRWRGGGVYVDGTPIGVLRYAELPRSIQPIWEIQQHRLPFKPGEQVRYRETKVPRFRVTDYLAAVGVRLDDVVQVHFHGGRDSAIVLTRDDLRRHPDDILFKFAGDTFGKPIPIVRGVEVATTFDDLKAMTIYIKREPPKLAPDQSLELDGRRVGGIPYRGEPLRNGVRVYVDDRLAAVLKRKELPFAQTRFHLAEVLAREGVTARIARAELINDETRTLTLATADFDFTFDQSGKIMIGTEATPADSIALYSTKL